MNNTNTVYAHRRAFLTTIGSIGAVTLLSSCGKSEKPENSTPPTNESPSEIASDNGGTETQAQPLDKIDYSKNNEFGIVLGDETHTDEHGEYKQLTVSDESVLMKFDKNVVDESVFNAFTEDEVKSAQQFIAPFIVESADSTLLWDNSIEAKDEWLEHNIDKFSDTVQEDAVQEIKEPENDWYNLINGNANDWKSNVEPIYVEGQPRIAFSDIKLDSITAFLDEEENNEEMLRFDYEWTVLEDLYDGKETGVIVIRSAKSFALKRDGKGGWLITGWRGKFVYETATGENFDPSKKYAQEPFPEDE